MYLKDFFKVFFIFQRFKTSRYSTLWARVISVAEGICKTSVLLFSGVLPPPTWPAPDGVADSDGQASGLRQNEEIGGDAQMEGEEEEDYDLEDVKHIERELTEHGETVGDEQEGKLHFNTSFKLWK